MKNIHVLPTDKPSRLHSYCNNLKYLRLSKEPLYWIEALNIYITSNEEIKVNDYITDGYKVWQWKDDSSLLGRKKVILTTDQDLIAEGIQQIDDEFLEWFVKNPSCEEVEVEHIKVDDARPSGYNIIIPKKSTKDRIMSETSEEAKQKARDYGNSLVTKQETLEEAAAEYANKELSQELTSKVGNFYGFSSSFIEGYKLAQEQNKNLYSEEDLKNAFFSGCYSERKIKPREKCWEEFIEQFKKK